MQTTPNPALPSPVEVIPYRHETPLFWVSAVMAVYLWVLLIVFTVGIANPVVLLLGLLALFAHSLLIAWVKGNAVHVTAEQFPDLHALYQQSCARLGITQPPELYLAQADGMLNALATRFMRRDYVVLLSSVVDALSARPEAVKFYMGHELGHVKRKHLSRHWWMWPALAMPLIAPAYSRACEYTCDRHGLACCNNLDDARRALAVLVAGEERWQQLNIGAFAAQSEQTGGFWMAVNELTADYPWLCKRMVVLEDREARFPRRSFFAWMIAIVSPRLGYGGAVIGFLYWLMLAGVIIALVGALAFGVNWSTLGERLRHGGTNLEQIEQSAEDGADTESGADSTDPDGTGASAAAAAATSAAELDALEPAHQQLTEISKAINRHIASHSKPPEELSELALDDALTRDVEYVAAIPAGLSPELTLFHPLCEDCHGTMYFRYNRTMPDNWMCIVVGVPQKALDEHGVPCVSHD